MSKNKIKIDKREYGDWVLSLNNIQLEIFSTREYARSFVRKFKNELDNAPKLSIMFDIAADKYLSRGYDVLQEEIDRELFSCNSVRNVINVLHEGNPLYKLYVEKFLISMGLDIYSTTAFNEFRAGSTRQSVRYAWLKFASMIAAEDGI